MKQQIQTVTAQACQELTCLVVQSPPLPALSRRLQPWRLETGGLASSLAERPSPEPSSPVAPGRCQDAQLAPPTGPRRAGGAGRSAPGLPAVYMPIPEPAPRGPALPRGPASRLAGLPGLWRPRSRCSSPSGARRSRSARTRPAAGSGAGGPVAWALQTSGPGAASRPRLRGDSGGGPGRTGQGGRAPPSVTPPHQPGAAPPPEVPSPFLGQPPRAPVAARP